MKVSGFTFIRNAVLYDYPIVESILSVLPLVDEMVVAVGNSTDETEKLILSINSPKIKIIHTVWNDSLREGGLVLADETNKALLSVSAQSDWAFYLQGDEIIHERYIPNIRKAMEECLNSPEVEGLLFKYLHFYGSYNYVGSARNWYRNEIRIIRPNIGVKSHKDAQGFRIGNRKLNVCLIDAFVYHYGWVKPPTIQQQKISSFNKLWHSDSWIDENIPKVDTYDYSNIDMLKVFDGTHPEVMKERIAKINWDFKFDPNKSKPTGLKNKLLFAFEHLSGHRLGEYKNYRIIKKITSI